MEQLKTGIIQYKDLAKWFGISEKTIHKSKAYKEKKLKELENFCKFEIIGKKINILEVYEPIYIKDGEKIDREVKKRLLKDIKSKEPFTCVQMGDKYYYLLNKQYGGTKGAYEYRVKKARNELWGKPNAMSNCHKALTKYYRGRTPSENVYILLTPEEKELTREVYEEIFGEITQSVNDLWGKITKYANEDKTAKDILRDLGVSSNIYKQYLAELAKRFACNWVVNATVVNDTSILISKEEFEKDFNF